MFVSLLCILNYIEVDKDVSKDPSITYIVLLDLR